MAFKFNIDKYSNIGSHVSDKSRLPKKSEEELQNLARNIDNAIRVEQNLPPIEDAENSNLEKSQNFYKIPLDKIKLSPYNKFRQFDDKEENSIESLKHSLSMVGLIHPLLVNDNNDGTYTIIAGERRYRAITELGWETATCQITNINNILDTRIAIYQANTETRTYTTEEKLVLCEELIEILEERQKETGVHGSILQKCADILNISYRQVTKYKQILDKKKQLESLGEEVNLVSVDGEGKSLNKINKELTEKLNEINGVTPDEPEATDENNTTENTTPEQVSTPHYEQEFTTDITVNTSDNSSQNNTQETNNTPQAEDNNSDNEVTNSSVNDEISKNPENLENSEKTFEQESEQKTENNQEAENKSESTETLNTNQENTTEIATTSKETLTYPIFEGQYKGETVTGIGFNNGNVFHLVCISVNEQGNIGIKVVTPEQDSIHIIGNKNCFTNN